MSWKWWVQVFALIAVVAVLVDCDWFGQLVPLQVLDVSLCHQNAP